MIKKLIYILIFISFAFSTEIYAKNVIFHYTYDGKNFDNIIKQFLPSQTIENKKKYRDVIDYTKYMNLSLINEPPKIGTKVKVKIDKEHIDFKKLRAYYLKKEGGNNYTNEMFDSEANTNRKANQYNNEQFFRIGYVYTPIMEVNQTSGVKVKNNLSSLIGLMGSYRYNFNNTEKPLWASFEFEYNKLSNATGFHQSHPVVVKESFNLPSNEKLTLKIGKKYRSSSFSPYAQFSYLSTSALRFFEDEDKSFATKTSYIALGGGAELMLYKNSHFSTKINSSLMYAVITQIDYMDYPTDLNESVNSFIFEFSGEIKLKSNIFFSGKMDLIQSTGDIERTISDFKLTIGREF